MSVTCGQCDARPIVTFTDHWLVPNYTAWWQRHMWVALDRGEARIRTHNLLITSPASQPLHHWPTRYSAFTQITFGRSRRTVSRVRWRVHTQDCSCGCQRVTSATAVQPRSSTDSSEYAGNCITHGQNSQKFHGASPPRLITFSPLCKQHINIAMVPLNIIVVTDIQYLLVSLLVWLFAWCLTALSAQTGYIVP